MFDSYPLLRDLSIHKLKQMHVFELEALSTQIRLFLIETLSQTGGHLAPNLGVVELTIALFRVFNSPTDKFIWDIGHQSYVHKIITGRAEQFTTLRQYGGLSGFIKQSESPHDVWEAGHASTSLSAGAGLVIDNKLNSRKGHVISIIGDGALTGGMALEAMNHIGDLGYPHIIILNDNNMSISENVGALSKHINGLRINPTYIRVKKNTKFILSKIKKPGQVLSESMRWTKAKIKSIMLQNTDNTFFDTMGLDYLGPIDGHDFEQLEAALTLAKNKQRPVVVHVLTIKGKGYNPAENDAKGNWHGIGPYNSDMGEKIRKNNPLLRQWSSVVSETIERLAQNDSSIVVVTPAMLKGSKLVHFSKKFPDRTFDVGIAEEHAMTFTAGLGLQRKLKPFLAIYSTFVQRAYDQLIHDVARQKIPVIVGIDRCGFAGGDGETHHGIYDVNIMLGIPNMVIAMGKDSVETQNLLHSAFYDYDLQGPMAIRYPRGYTSLEYVARFEQVPFATWEYLIEQEESNAVILSFGPKLETAKEVAKELLKAGQKIDVVNARFIKPMDEQMLDIISQKYQYIITIEESAKIGGFGQLVLSEIYARNSHAKVIVFAIDDVFIEQGDNNKLQEIAGISTEAILKQLKEVVK